MVEDCGRVVVMVGARSHGAAVMHHGVRVISGRLRVEAEVVWRWRSGVRGHHHRVVWRCLRCVVGMVEGNWGWRHGSANWHWEGHHVRLVGRAAADGQARLLLRRALALGAGLGGALRLLR